jgi:hypothetical protein
MRKTGLSRYLPATTSILFAAFLSLALPASASAQESPVDAAIVLAIDVSFSVDDNEFRQQMQGLGNAFHQADIKKAIHNGPHGQIAVAAIQWSDADYQMVIVPWRIIASDADADALGTLLSSMPRKLAPGGTSISMALEYSAKLLTEAPPADRRIIDVSSDGRNNVGPPVSAIRDELVAKGITINAVVIMNEWPTLDVYFEKTVVGGEGHFVIPAHDYIAYADAIYHKLLREIIGPGIS